MTKFLVGMSLSAGLIGCADLSRSGEYRRESQHWITLLPPPAPRPQVSAAAVSVLPPPAAMPELTSLAPLPRPAHEDPHQPEDIQPDLEVLNEALGEVLPPPGSENWEKRTIQMNITGYCACPICCGWVRNSKGKPVYASGPNKGKPKVVGFTASGQKAAVGTIAADAKLLPFGTRVHVNGYGYGTVQDRGEAIQGASLDLFFPTHEAAKKWGRKSLPVTVWMPPAELRAQAPGSKRR
ncbi:MAG: hypothetical protein RL095_3344 [Verrucomicrobiota bacterium]|jgi:3D (Asp-Asp-Asp) domain-containing protein